MKQFIALLALVIGLLLVEAKADETPIHCIHPRKDVIEMAEHFKAQGFKTLELKGKEAQDYLTVLREGGHVPEFPGVELLVITNDNVAAVAFVLNKDNHCGYAKVNWALHVKALKAAKGAAI